MMFENSDNSWIKYMRQVQSKKNTSFHSTIGKTPFQALVHRKPPLGITELGIPIEAIDNIWSEEDLELVTEEMNNQFIPLRPEEYDNFCEVHYYEIQVSVIPIYSNPSDNYMEEISLPPSLNLHVFEENTHPESSGISKFPPINFSHQSQACILPQASINGPTNSISYKHLAIDTTSPLQPEESPESAECKTRLQGHIVVQGANGTCIFFVGDPMVKKDLELAYGILSVTCIGYNEKVKWSGLELNVARANSTAGSSGVAEIK